MDDWSGSGSSVTATRGKVTRPNMKSQKTTHGEEEDGDWLDKLRAFY